MTIVRWWRSGPSRIRTRRRLLVFSAPVALVLLVVIVKLVSGVVASNSAASAFTDRDTAALRSAVSTLEMVNVVQPAKAPFAAGALAVIENRLEDADREFSASLAHTDTAKSCPARVNLELVRETLGDRAAAIFDGETAVAWYLGARAVVEEAPQECFAGNTDADPQRRALRNDAETRLDAKISAARIAPPPPAPAPSTAPAAPPPALSGAVPTGPDTPLRLNPGTGDPLERLRQILRDAAARGGG